MIVSYKRELTNCFESFERELTPECSKNGTGSLRESVGRALVEVFGKPGGRGLMGGISPYLFVIASLSLHIKF